MNRSRIVDKVIKLLKDLSSDTSHGETAVAPEMADAQDVDQRDDAPVPSTSHRPADIRRALVEWTTPPPLPWQRPPVSSWWDPSRMPGAIIAGIAAAVVILVGQNVVEAAADHIHVSTRTDPDFSVTVTID